MIPQEKRLISKFFEEISLDTGKYVFGVKVGALRLLCIDSAWLLALIAEQHQWLRALALQAPQGAAHEAIMGDALADVPPGVCPTHHCLHLDLCACMTTALHLLLQPQTLPACCVQLQDTLMCLEMGAIETLIVWENFDVERIEVMGPGGKNDVKHLTPEQVSGTHMASLVCRCLGGVCCI